MATDRRLVAETAQELMRSAQAVDCYVSIFSTGHDDQYQYAWNVRWSLPSKDRSKHLCDVTESGAEPTLARAVRAAGLSLARITAAILILEDGDDG